MCRICGRMVKCFFESMPSRVPTSASTRYMISFIHRTPSHTCRAFSTAARTKSSRTQPQHVSSRQLLRATFDTNTATSAAPPSFLLPHRRKLHQVSTLQQEPTHAAQFQNTQTLIPPEESILASDLVERAPFSTQVETEPQSSTTITSTPSQPPKPLVLSKSLQTLLPALHAQPPHYITTHIHRFPYLITAGDTLRLPFHLHGVSPGDTLRFNRASILGSRDFTLKAGTSHNSEYYDGKRTNEPNYLDERLFECRVRVLGVESQPMTFKEKTKRRNRKVKTVKSKHKYTVLKVMEVKVKSLEELKAGKDFLLLE